MPDKHSSQKIELVANKRPNILCIDIANDIVENLKSSRLNITSGTLGNKIEIPNNAQHISHQLLLNFDFPSNLHEYDIIIIDLNNHDTIQYKSEDHVRTQHTGKSSLSILCSYPETLFDPRPLSSLILNDYLNQIGNRPHMILAFTSKNYETEYETIKIGEKYNERQGTQTHGIYSFINNCPLSKTKFGKEITVCDVNADLRNLLEKLKPQTSYNQTFSHPTRWENRQTVLNPSWFPLLKNSSGEIVSISEFRENSTVFYLPQFEDKKTFLSEFLLKIAPSIQPELFPFATTFSWRENESYWLPNHEKLIEEKKTIEADYSSRLKAKDAEISLNQEEFSFLHEIITETGDSLVDCLISFFKWLGFTKVIDVDKQKTETEVLEEDIQVELDEGLLIIECKGIGGTSTDSECNQISKIKHRRCKKRNKFDVFALYIVNHQRYMPPINRQNPPFSKNQIQDAINDERGLISTWQLFNLYFDIESGVLTKKEAQKELLEFGVINFKPKNLLFINEPQEIFKNGTVCIINIDDCELNIGEKLFVEKNDQFKIATITGIQQEGKPVSSVSTGEVGIEIDIPIKKKSKLWKQCIN